MAEVSSLEQTAKFKLTDLKGAKLRRPVELTALRGHSKTWPVPNYKKHGLSLRIISKNI
jgi:hypothetical protein